MTLLLLALALAAPVPKETKDPPNVTHGVYTLMWGGQPYQATLNGNGEFSEFLGEGSLWVGTWEWNPVTRAFSVCETYNGGVSWYQWTATLDRNLGGTTGQGTKISLKPH